jgi:hypothetical protein
MKQAARKGGRPATLSRPVDGVRLRPDQIRALADLTKATGMSRAEILREGCDVMINKLINGEEANG